MLEQYNYKPMGTLAGFVNTMLMIYLTISVASIVSSFMMIDLLSTADFNDDLLQLYLQRDAVLSMVLLIIYIPTAIGFAKWIHRSNNNARALGAISLPISPGWSVGYFFIPIMNLWKPYHAMRDISAASRNARNWYSENSLPIVLIWWFLYLIALGVDRVGGRMWQKADTVETLTAAAQVCMIGTLIGIPLTLAAFSMISQITKGIEEQSNDYEPVVPHPHPYS
ncbi:DUF4328 domain-containing protein [uncultured Rubinisphaera sp.]|uniref:DUF4328 domain-containing protein n=1 Tax=uncultured Rubinisphaera sp. TaxID=1678686 RepID=UPI0030DAE2D4